LEEKRFELIFFFFFFFFHEDVYKDVFMKRIWEKDLLLLQNKQKFQK
jgi:hypothetical protein